MQANGAMPDDNLAKCMYLKSTSESADDQASLISWVKSGQHFKHKNSVQLKFQHHKYACY